ncbi:IS200/IS605 family transposase [candidate division KSB1 bacterium]|nr:IS200/IS605 family transposase [candidate division KSB1 bacterium]RQW10794.1 MAG: IS200/IS605 family transposase [candidate division KSB1 bacterium]
MANTFTQIYIQIIFAVESRASLIKDQWREELHKYITGIIQNHGHKLIVINSVENHIHIFIGMKPRQSLSDLLKNIKEYSSKWINQNKFVLGHFKWQAGFGAFSYSHSQINTVVKYIQNQKQHHAKKSFQREYIEFLEKFGVEYSTQYIFKDIE